MNKWFCYILQTDTNTMSTYNGSTNNMVRRLRQHNGELVGGAKYTKRNGANDWKVYFLMTGFLDHQNCLQAEWRIKCPDNKRRRGAKYNGREGRIRGINEILKLQKWTSNSVIDNSTVNYEIWIVKKYSHLLTEYPTNIIIHEIDEEFINVGNIIHEIDEEFINSENLIL